MDKVPSYSTASSYLLFPGAFRALGKIGSTTLLDFSSATIAVEKTRINESAMELFATLTRIGDCVRMVFGIIATYYTNPVGQHPDILLKRLLDSRGVRPEESKYIVQFRRAIQLSESMHVHVNALLATSNAVCEDIAHLREYMAEPKLLGGEQGLDVFLKSISKDMKQSRVQ
ncbi:hypothetical protein BD410DRAFT_551287 [Rickenella mellea]|uniref:Uncharacterized protein n=1 Tax=Rickenella mellea TaxID=50990 RepID=A0A4Y7PPP3_9AGAM|nr:hypothetical protein BD410DRAFT_551287 [Rickenella mellea]